MTDRRPPESAVGNMDDVDAAKPKCVDLGDGSTPPQAGSQDARRPGQVVEVVQVQEVLKNVSASVITFELSTQVHVAASTFFGTNLAHPTEFTLS